jgi:CPA2 family monovalent cation:H+ antiporter-2
LQSGNYFFTFIKKHLIFNKKFTRVIEAYKDILIFLCLTIFVDVAARRAKFSPVLGYLIVGILIGPYLFNIIHGIEASKHWAEAGIIFLLFSIGLELSWERLIELRRYVFGLGMLQVILTSTIIGSLLYYGWLGSSKLAILLGGGLALSSTAIVLKVITDRNELSTRTGQITFSILLAQDISVVFLLIWVNTVASENSDLWPTLGLTLVKALGVLVAIALVGRFLLRPIYRLVASTRHQELFVATTLFILLSFSFATGSVGLSHELGAFLAGLLLAETEYVYQIEADIKPIKSILLGLFFMTIGMSLNPNIIISYYWYVGLGAIGLISIKAMIIMALCYLFSAPIKTCVKTGLLAAGGGEFIFVLLAQATDKNIVPDIIVQVVNTSVFITMALTPYLASLGKFLGTFLPSPIGVALKRAEAESKDLKRHVIVVGFGHVGSYIYKILTDRLIPIVAFDSNMRTVALGREKDGAQVFFGDARRSEIYHALGAERAKAIVITLSDFNVALRAVKQLRRTYPNVPIFARAMNKNQAIVLREANANPIMPEAYAPSLQLAARVLHLLNFTPDQIDQTISRFRQEHFKQDDFSDFTLDWKAPVNPDKLFH